jgi:hypothetical protein
VLRLTRLYIQNFQSVRERQVIEFAPITLLYGRNSAGKSVIADALQFFGDVMRGEATLQQLRRWRSTNATGNEPTTIGVGVEFDEEFNLTRMMSRLGLSELGRIEGQIDHDKNLELWNTWSLFGIKTDDNKSRAPKAKMRNKSRTLDVVVSMFPRDDWAQSCVVALEPNIVALEIVVDGNQLIEIGDAGARVSINMNHPIFLKGCSLWDAGWDLKFHAKRALDALDDAAKQLFVELNESRLSLKSLYMPFIGLTISPTFSVPMGTKERRYFLHEWEDEDCDGPTIRDKYLGKRLTDSAHEDIDIIRKILVGLATYPSKICGAIAESALRVGPIRAIPEISDLTWIHNVSYRDELKGHKESYWDDSEFDSELQQNKKGWVDGASAWKVIVEDEEKRAAVNLWLHKLGLTTQVIARTYRMEPVSKALSSTVDAREGENNKSITSDDAVDPPVGYPSEAGKVNVLFLLDRKSNSAVRVNDVGTGSSQVIPVLTALLENSIIRFIEQPELHLHPSMQLQLAEVLADAHHKNVKKTEISFWLHNQILPTTIVETHSEHIALRCLKLIREKKRQPASAPGLKASDLKFVYCQSTDAGAKFSSIRVDSKGRFVDQWPEGFFRERADEIF